MSTATLERPIAILYEGKTATWCRGGCGKFRYPYCYVEDRPYCEGCAFIARLEAVTAQPKKEVVVTQKSSTKQLIPSFLKEGPLSTKDLAAHLKLCLHSVNLAANKLAAEGIIVAKRQRGNSGRMPMYYALPEHAERLKEITGESLPELILNELKHGAKTRDELHNVLRNKILVRKFHLRSLRKALTRLIHDGRVAKKRRDNLWLYQLSDAEHG